MIGQGKSKGVFLLQSPAQLKMGQRLKSRNLLDLACQVALIRPGVGVQGSAVSQFVERYRRGASWDYDHPLEQRALERGYGIIVWQEQVVQLIMGRGRNDRGPGRRDKYAPSPGPTTGISSPCTGSGSWKGRGARECRRKRRSGYSPRSTGSICSPKATPTPSPSPPTRAAWLKRYHPLEFFVSLVNNQPMGFYPVETLKQDARRFGVPFLNPCVNRSGVDCILEEDSLLLGLRFVKDVGAASARAIVEERDRHGPYAGAGDLVRRTGLKPRAVESLVMAGAFDSLNPNRRKALWDAGLSIRPRKNGQRAFAASAECGVPDLADFTGYEKMAGEYRVMGVYPKGHLMEFLRPSLDPRVLPAAAVQRRVKERK